MHSVLDMIVIILDLFKWVIIAVVIMSWLVSFNVVNLYNSTARAIWNGLNAVTEPVLRPIRNALPNFNGLDLSPVVVILLIVLIQKLIGEYNPPHPY